MMLRLRLLLKRRFKYLDDGLRRLLHIVTEMEAAESFFCHLGSLDRGRCDPSSEQVQSAFGRIEFHQAGAVTGNLFGDIDLVGEQDWRSAGHGFGNGYAEVLLMGGKNE